MKHKFFRNSLFTRTFSLFTLLFLFSFASAQDVVLTLEAEDGELTQPAKVKEVAGYSGNKYVGDNNSGSAILFTDVEVAEAGTYEFKTYYTCMQLRSIAVKVNSYPEAISNVVNTTPGWDAPPTATMSTYIYLNQGTNTIKITPFPSDKGGPNMDKFEILTTDSILPKPGDFPILLEAESAQLFGDLKVKPTNGTTLPELSGGRYVGDFHVIARSYMKFEDIEIPEEGTYELRIYSMGASRPLAIKSNNYEVSIIKTASSPNWDSGPTTIASTLIYLNEGKNMLRLGLAFENGSNFDKFEIHQTDQIIQKPAIDDSPFPEVCEITDDYKISFMGSSVCAGMGASGDKGYAYLYTNLLKERYEQGLGQNWTTSNISVPGNNTSDLLRRWENDLINQCSRYVIYGLSLGNEGIHERGEEAFNSYRDGMLKAIEQARDSSIIPVMANNYTREDFNEQDYNYTKQMNLLIHEWDVPSINTLGAVDDGAGHWATGYQNDGAHPNTAGHEEFFYAMVPSLFDALDAGKPQPQIVNGTSYKLGSSVVSDQIEFIPENIVHPFTLSFEIKTTSAGTIASFENETGTGLIKINSEGKVIYESPEGNQISATLSVTDNEWKRITLTHYYARGVTMLYVNNERGGEISEKLVPKKFILSGENAPAEIYYRQLFFWRAGMNAEEISAVNAGRMLKSSLEIYAPLGGDEPLTNLAQSTNILSLEHFTPSSLQTISNEFIYRNPVKRGEKIKIAGAGMIRIYSLGGQLVSEQEMLKSSAISTNTLTAGTYLIQLTDKNKTRQSVLIIN